MTNASDPQQVAEATTKAKRKQQQEDTDLLVVMSSEEGRRFLWRLLCSTGLRRSSYTGNSETFFREGERNVGLRLQAEMERVDYTLFTAMQREAHALES